MDNFQYRIIRLKFVFVTIVAILALLNGGRVVAGNLEEIARKFKDPTSFYLLGERFSKGRGVAQDYAKAIMWYLEAAKLGHLRSQLRLGKIFYYGTGVAPDFEKARKWLSIPARDGSSDAQYLLGMIFLEGKGTTKDINKALKYFELANGDRHTAATLQLGFIYYKGLQVSKDVEKAKAILTQDHVKNVDKALRLMEEIKQELDSDQNIPTTHQASTPKEFSNATRLESIPIAPQVPPVTANVAESPISVVIPKTAQEKLLESAENGNPNAQYRLGMAYLHGSQMFSADRQKSKYWLEKSAAQTYVKAEFELGMMEYDPESIGDFPGLKWLIRAAKHGHVEAQYYLGSLYGGRKDFETAKYWLTKAIEKANDDALDLAVELYFSGKFENVDGDIAESWLLKAAIKGLNEAQFRLGEIYLSSTSEHKQKQARLWLERAAIKGHVMAQYLMGQMFLQGRGVDKTYTKSAAWIRKAAEQGNKDAQFQLAELYRKGMGLPKSTTKAAKWYQLAAEQGHQEAKLILGQRRLY